MVKKSGHPNEDARIGSTGSPCVTDCEPSRGPDLEVYFRIVHLAQNSISRARAAIYEHTVEIALGPKGAFENGNIGTMTRQMAADPAVTVLPPLRGNPKRPKELKKPRVVELLRKAIEWQALLESGKIASQADIARREGITRANFLPDPFPDYGPQ